jgi:hypothetical protein
MIFLSFFLSFYLYYSNCPIFRFVAFCGTLCTVCGLIFAAFSSSTLDMALAFGFVIGIESFGRYPLSL